jgi:hypothetical protein
MRYAFALGLTFLVASTAIATADTYPTYATKPFQAIHKDMAYNLHLFQTTGEMVSSTIDDQPVFVASLYMLRNVDNDEYTVCGGAVIGTDRHPTEFVISHAHVYTEVDETGWQSLGCNTRGGTMMKWVPRKDGSGGNDIRVVPETIAQKGTKKVVPPPAAKPPSFIPAEAKLRITFELESSISQVLGVRFHLTSVHDYEELDGDRTSCIIGTAGGKRIRFLSGKGAPKIQPTQAEWVAGGCTRPGYILMR